MTSLRFPQHRTARVLSASLCLVSGLALGACGSNSSDAATTAPSRSSQYVANSTPLPAPTMAATTSPAPDSVMNTQRPDASATTAAPNQTQTKEAWSAPALKFYNEDTSVWYQDDTVVNTDSVSDRGNIEGFRTWDHACIGYETRDISERIHYLGLDDDTMSSLLVPVSDSVISDYNETGRETLDLVRDDGGTMEGYSVTWTGTFNYDDGTSESVEGYRFARAVGDAGLDFSVEIICSSGNNVSADQWHTILSGIRIEGLKAGKMSS